MTPRERLIAHIRGEPVDCIPVMPITMMFAADQIGAPYSAYAMDYHVLVDAQIKTAEKFGLDHVSCISDPAREAADCGAQIRYFEDQPPAIDESNARLANKADLLHLQVPDPLGGGRMTDRIMAADLFKKRVGNFYLIEGWIEGPCAEAADLRGINTLMTDFYDDPKFVIDLFEFIVQMEIEFAKAQIDVGVDIIGIGDAAASLVGPSIYNKFVWPYEKKMIDAIHELGAMVRLHICGNISKILEPIGKLGCEIVDIDLAPMDSARIAMGDKQLLTANIHPVRILKDGSPELITQALDDCYKKTKPRFIVGAGCEVPRGTPEENFRAMINFGKTRSP